MAKRSRGGSRPGQLRPARREARVAERPAPGGTPVPPGGLTEAEEARAAELEAALLSGERAAEAARARPRSESGGQRSRGRDASLLAARAEQEYTYVVRDVRRIATVGGLLLGILAVLFVLIDVAGVVTL
jgi:hypothetical protein